MKSISLQNRKDSDTIKGVKIDGFTLAVMLTSVGGGFSGNLIDTDKLTLTATLRKRRGMEDKVIFNHTLRDLLTLSHLLAPAYEYVLNPSMFIPRSNPFVTPTDGLVPLRFWIGGIIDLTGKDGGEIFFEWSMQTDFFGASVNTAASSILIDVVENDGAEYYTPYMETRLIEPSQDKPKFDCGDDVTEIVLANFDKNTLFKADQVLEKVVIISDTYKRTDDYDEVVAKAINHYSDVTDALLRKQKFVLYKSDADLDNCRVELTLKGSNLTAGNNVLLLRKRVTSDWHATRAGMYDAKRLAVQSKKGDFNDKLAANFI